ncbi:uncharacterized protein [Epargyreus clarus]|uniref:uncharacterized protein n=1 Tax=Epargyreus clarus TaxID=520877 RepID=UPI003C302C3B
MDSPSVQSGSKCSSSDFSINRILGETQSSQERPDPPSWLCCTRYQPPRLPRSNTISASRSRRSGRHARVPFTGAQAAALEAAYSRAPYLAPPALRALAAALQLREDRIKIWFQNRRARERREKNVNITPPRAVTLQPTAVSRVTSQDLRLPWNHSFLDSNLTPTDYRQKVVDSTAYSLVSSDSGSAIFYPINYGSRSHSNDPENIPTDDNNRSESPLDIETVDS